PSLEGGNVVDVYVLPGYAWDGYGRPVVVTAPYKVAPELFEAVAAGERLVDVWLQYEEEILHIPRPDCGACSPDDSPARVAETFRLMVGRAVEQFHAVTVAGRSLAAASALHAFAPGLGSLNDASVPFQTFSADGAHAHWLIPLGRVRWQPGSAAGAV